MELMIKDFIKRKKIKSGDDLANLSDKIWEIGNLGEIKSKVIPELFILHVMINVIGNWQGSGWLGILHYQKELIPYISHALAEFELHEMKDNFQNIASLYPNIANFSKEEEKLYREKLEAFEDVSDHYWGYDAPNEGWEGVLAYIKKRLL